MKVLSFQDCYDPFEQAMFIADDDLDGKVVQDRTDEIYEEWLDTDRDCYFTDYVFPILEKEFGIKRVEWELMSV